MAQTEVKARQSSSGPAAKTPEEVLNHHLQAFGAGDLKGMLEDFTDESVIITANGVLRTQGEIARFFKAFLDEFAKPGAAFSMGQQVIEDETAFITWSAETADNVYDLGTDTFWIHDGKILVQTYAGKVTPKS